MHQKIKIFHKSRLAWRVRNHLRSQGKIIFLISLTIVQNFIGVSEVLAIERREISGLTSVNERPDKIEVAYNNENTLPYQERRRPHAASFAVNMEKFYPKNLESFIDDDVFYSDVFGKKDIDLYRVEGGYKFNFSLGSIGVLGSFAFGTVQETISTETHTIEATHYRGSLMYAMDNVFVEPWIVPYGQLHLGRFQISESVNVKSSSEDSSYTTTKSNTFSIGYAVGGLVQLNWVDKRSALQAFLDWGLENTFLDIFFTQYFKSVDAADIDTAAGMNWGAGLRLEF